VITRAAGGDIFVIVRIGTGFYFGEQYIREEGAFGLSMGQEGSTTVDGKMARVIVFGYYVKKGLLGHPKGFAKRRGEVVSFPRKKNLH